ncbi:MAG: fumarate hydratase subunit alpha [Candidatus Atribacteria bacterium]|nr:fumarate hydratase subunit alpha [Candidatus Atribacteria bacterium]
MKVVIWDDIVQAVKTALLELNTTVPPELRQHMLRLLTEEENEISKEMVSEILENYEVAQEKKLPLCQDTGMVMAEVRVGDQLLVEGGTIRSGLDEAIRLAYREGYFRKSIVSDPFWGKNTEDNTPGVYFFDLMAGDSLEISLLVKGGGCDNITALGMLNPGDGPEEVEKYVLNELEKKAARACPPLVVGVGIGGNGAYALYLASHALARPLGQVNADRRYRELEEKWKQDINALGIGPQGVGGKNTCLEVRIESYPCHIASLPVGLVSSCHVFRQKTLKW